MKKLFDKIKQSPVKESLIKDAKDLFSWIDSDFENYGASEPQKITKKTELEVYELTENGTFKDIFKNPEQQCLTQGQILDFVKNHKDKLRTDGYATFFLFKSNNNFFVAFLRFGAGGLDARVHRFEGGHVWDAERRHRVVMPTMTKEKRGYDSWQQRFANKISKKSNNKGCILWEGAIMKDRYGNFRINDKNYKAHRLAYEIKNGEIPEGMVIDHIWMVKNCVNPDHLRITTIKDNVISGIKQKKCKECGGIPATSTLDTDTDDTLNLGDLDALTLEKAIEICKENGLTITKIC